jgi:hypothetical protein
MQPAILIGRVQGKPVYRFPVVVTFNDPMGTVDDWCNPPTIRTDVLSHSARDAADWAQENVARRRENSEVLIIGPKGGKTRRFTGYESAIWHAMATADHSQRSLF